MGREILHSIRAMQSNLGFGRLSTLVTITRFNTGSSVKVEQVARLKSSQRPVTDLMSIVMRGGGGTLSLSPLVTCLCRGVTMHEQRSGTASTPSAAYDLLALELLQ